VDNLESALRLQHTEQLHDTMHKASDEWEVEREKIRLALAQVETPNPSPHTPKPHPCPNPFPGTALTFLKVWT
jgi:hypothetical protein